ncbi:MAG: sigma-70 family RNA polymerase sigma factor [Planctomycetota bacterium]
MDDESVRLVHRWQSGDEVAAGEIYDRYIARLISLAGSRISPRLARRVEAEDVVQSVYRSFFARSGASSFQVEHSGQLWGLLAAITVNKVRQKARFHGAEKRNVAAEASVQSSVSCFGLVPTDLARDPSAEEATMLAEQYEIAMQSLSPLGRQVFELYLDNQTAEAIAKQVRRSARTVRREMEQIRTRLGDMLSDVQAIPS